MARVFQQTARAKARKTVHDQSCRRRTCAGM